LHPSTLPKDPSSELTQREKTIVRQVSLGMTNRQIAETLFLSTHTVTTHRKNISSKLGIKSVSGLTVYAIVNNIITIEEVNSKPLQ
jgi:DNA-binding NarL/FixJ family response regulator